jgi:hypothetical protein
LEIQQNTNAVRAGAIQEATNVARQQLYLFGENRELAELGVLGYDNLDEVDQQRAQNLQRAYWIGMQNLYRQWEMGVLPDADWDVWYGIVCRARARAHPEIWARQSSLYPDFLAAVDRCSTEDPK